MRKKLISALLVCVMIGATGCSSGMTESEVDKKIESAIEKNNKQLKNDIMDDLDEQIQAKIDEQDKLTDDEKNALKSEIMQSVGEKLSNVSTQQVNVQTGKKAELTESTATKVVEKQKIIQNTPVNKNYTNVTNITKIEQTSNEPEKVVDGTPIAVEMSAPVVCTQYNRTTYIINTITATIYNHDNEPYREIKYPYEIHISITGTYRKYQPADADYSTEDNVLIMEPYSTPLGMWNEVLDEDTHTFTADYQTTLNIVPDKIIAK